MPAPRVSGREKWKYKKWFTIVTPKILGEIPVANVPADDASKMIGRSIEVTLYDLTGDVTQLHIRFLLQVVDVQENIAKTVFKQVYLSRDYLRSLTKRKSSKITLIKDFTTKDNARVRVTATVFTTYRCKTSQKKLIRGSIREVLENMIREMKLDEFIQNIISGTVQNKLFEVSKKIYPVRKAEIAKVKILRQPEIIEEKSVETIPSAQTSS
jgi:small subunit ribosomal protein S3Ae